MDRLTFRTEDDLWTVRTTDGTLLQGPVADLLAQYEDLGLTPQEILDMKTALQEQEDLQTTHTKPWREVLDLPTRAVNALRFSRLTENMTVAELAQIKEWQIVGLRSIGPITRKQIAQELARHGFHGTDWSLTDY